MALVSVSAASQLLGVSAQRVHQLLQSGVLVGQRPGHEWLIDESDLPRSHHQPPGRPLSPRSAWAVALFAHSEDLARDLLSPSDRSQAKGRLRELVRLRNEMVHGVKEHSVEDLASYLSQVFRNRAKRRPYRVSRRDLDDLRRDDRVRPSGVSSSASEISAGEMLEAYVDERDVNDVVEQYLLDQARPGLSNVVLHVVPDDVRSLAASVPADLWLLVAADLNEHPGPREFVQALRLLDGLEELESSDRLSRYGRSNRG